MQWLESKTQNFISHGYLKFELCNTAAMVYQLSNQVNSSFRSGHLIVHELMSCISSLRFRVFPFKNELYQSQKKNNFTLS